MKINYQLHSEVLDRKKAPSVSLRFLSPSTLALLSPDRNMLAQPAIYQIYYPTAHCVLVYVRRGKAYVASEAGRLPIGQKKTKQNMAWPALEFLTKVLYPERR